MGKTAMLQNMAIQDIIAGHGVGVVDPHGEFADAVLDFIPEERKKDLVYFNPSDYEHAMGFNVLENVDFDQRHLVASGLMGVFKKLWPDVWSARMEYILNNAILALLEYPEATMLGINRLFSNAAFRKDVVSHITDPVVKVFWTDEYAKYTQRLEAEATAAIQNKVGQFTTAPLIRNIIGQVKSTINVREIMDSEKIFIANLSKGKLGEDNSRLLGSMLMTKIYLAAMSRVDLPEAERKDFFFYVDEFQNFQSKAFADVLSEARKYRLSLILAHQYVLQMEEEVSDAIFGNVGTIVSFRVGAADAELLEKEFAPEFVIEDFVNLGKYRIILKLMIDGLASRGFSATTLPPIVSSGLASLRQDAIEHSRFTYTRPRAEIEEYIARWHEGLVEMKDVPPGAQSSGDARNSFERQNVSQVAESGEGARREIELFEAICNNCGKPTMVPFQPDGKRPVYCKKCRTKLQKRTSSTEASGPQSNAPALHQRKQPDLGALRDSLKEFVTKSTE